MQQLRRSQNPGLGVVRSPSTVLPRGVDQHKPSHSLCPLSGSLPHARHERWEKVSARHVEEQTQAPGGDSMERREVGGGGGRCSGRSIRLKALDPSAGANYYQRAEEQGLRSGVSHPGELLASGWISEESNTRRKIMGGSGGEWRTVEGGREEPLWKKVLPYCFFHSWLLLTLLLWCFHILPAPSFNSLKAECPVSRTDGPASTHKQMCTCQECR